MSRKEIILAAALMGNGFGQCFYQRDLGDNSSLTQDVTIYSTMTQYAPAAAAMVDAAFGVTFKYPENYEANIYWTFGDHFGDAVEWDDGFDHPDREWCLSALESFVLNSFDDVASASQKASLRKAVAQARAEHESA